ncbi:MAG: WD40 repeat domain-containing protein [Thermoplasmatales archaeon]|nr:WD40 repeat domain-containing protein [Thermoplasmatales archaeon]
MKIEPLWKYRTGGIVRDLSFSSINGDVAAASFDKNIYFISKEGKLLWKYQTSGQVSNVFLIPEYLSASSEDGTLYFFDRTGNLKWKCQTKGKCEDVASTYNGDYSIGGSDDSYVYFINKEGKLLWRYKTAGWVRRVCISSNAETIAAGSSDKNVYSFDKEGRVLWSYRMGSWVNTIVTTSDGKYIMLGLNDGNIYFFRNDGALLWKFGTPTPVLRLICSENAEYIVAGTENTVYFFSREGKMLWQYMIGNFDIMGLRMNEEGGIIGVGSGKNEIELVSKNKETLWKYKTDAWVTSLDVSIYGRYVAAGLENGKILFFDNKKIINDFVSEMEGKTDVAQVKEKLEQKKYSYAFRLINEIEKKMRGKKKVCFTCKKEMEEKWVACPFCGTKVE